MVTPICVQDTYWSRRGGKTSQLGLSLIVICLSLGCNFLQEIAFETTHNTLIIYGESRKFNLDPGTKEHVFPAFLLNKVLGPVQIIHSNINLVAYVGSRFDYLWEHTLRMTMAKQNMLTSTFCFITRVFTTQLLKKEMGFVW